MTDTYTQPVYIFHADAYGHVNNARWLEFFDAARNEMMARRGLGFALERKLMIVVKSIHVHYERPAKPGDTVEISSAWLELAERHAVLRQTATRSGKVCARADVTLAVLGPDSPRAQEIAGALRDWLES